MPQEVPLSIGRPLRILLAVQKAILVVCSLILAFVFFVVVILRYGFQADLFAYEEWVLMFAFWLYFIGGAQGSFENTHIKADFINAWVKSARIKWVIGIVTLGLETLVGAVLSYWGFLMVLEDAAQYPNWPATVAWKIPFVVPRFGIFLGLTLMTLFTALHLYMRVKRGPSPQAESADDPRDQGEGI